MMKFGSSYKSIVSTRKTSQSGNVFFLLFAAVAMIGAFTIGTSNIVKGIVTSMSDVTRKSVAEEKMTAASRLSVVAATSTQSNGGDCDNDGFVEPLPYRDAGTAPHPVGGGYVPLSIGAADTDPWGMQYGYCVWDEGSITVSNNNAGCGGSTAKRLNGSPLSKHTAVAIISAGKNRRFETTCNAYVDANADTNPDTPLVARGASTDDVIMEYTYDDANGLGGDDLWKVKDTKPTIATIAKNIEVSGSAQFSDALNLMQKGLILPADPGNNSVTGACDATTDQQLRINTSTSPLTLEICNVSGSGWGPVMMGSGNSSGPPSGMLGWWKFDETSGTTAADSAGTNPGTLTNMSTPSVWVAGHSGNALSFDGVNDFVNMGSAANLDNLSAITLCAWFKEDTATVSYPSLAGKTPSGTGTGFLLYLTQSGTNLSYRFRASDDALRGKTVANTAGPWKHLCATYSDIGHDYTTIGLYLDGAALSGIDFSHTGATTNDAADNFVVGGASSASTTSNFHGLIDDVILYNRVLSATEIKQVFTGTGGISAPQKAATPVGTSKDFLNCQVAQVGPGIKVGTGPTGTYDAFSWSDGTYLYSTGTNNGVHAYSVAADGSLTLLATYNTSINSMGLSGDGNYIYVPNFGGDTIALTFNGTSFTKVGQFTPAANGGESLASDGTYLYSPENTAGLVAYTFNGTAFTKVATYDSAGSARSVWVDGKYIYLSDYDGGLRVLTFNGTAFTSVANVVPASGYVTRSFGDGKYIYVAATSTLYAYKFDGKKLTQVATYTPGDFMYDLWGDGTNIYLGSTGGRMRTLNFTGSSFNIISVFTSGNNSNAYIYGDGKFIYLGNISTKPLTVLGGYACNVSPKPGPGLSLAVNQYRDKLASSQYTFCAINPDTTAWCWGYDDSGQLGNGATSTANKDAPTKVDGAGWVSISTGGSTTCGIKNDASLWCWGSDSSGQLGNGAPTADAPSPALVSGGGQWSKIAVGRNTCGIKTDGTAWCWGRNLYGERGDGTTGTTGTVPIQVADVGPWVDISPGSQSTCGVKADGTAWCWGIAANGQLGNGLTTPDKNVPVQVAEPGPWTQVSVGAGKACGLKIDGSAWCWGTQTSGGRGDGSITGDQLYPKRVKDPGPWVDIQTSNVGDSACLVKTDGTAWCMGDDTFGQLGNGALSGDQPLPSPVADPGSWASLKPGFTSACGIKTDGSVWCWGQDTAGLLGNGSTITANQNSPSRVQMNVPAKNAFTFNEAGTVLTAGANNINIGTTNYISRDGTSGNGFGFDGTGRSFLRQTDGGSQLLLDAQAASTSSQLSWKVASGSVDPKTFGLNYATGAFQIGLNVAAVTTWSNAITPLFEITPTGNVGIGTTGTAAAALDITKNGGLRIGNDTATCNALKAGTLRYNNTHTSQPFEYCNGSLWVNF